ncbi:MAG: UDP-N-acetylmuramoyl-L-alanine--D-glutamate ligase [Acetobacteraceae bacterium]
MSDFPPVFAGTRFAVVGLGRNGLPVARALVGMGAEVMAWDDDAAARARVDGFELRPPRAGDRLDALVLSPGIPHRLPSPHPLATLAIQQGWPILSDAELLFRAVRAAGSAARFVGITGTNGKSTTTALLAHILDTARIEVAAGGNLGTAALALPLLGDGSVYVLEMSSYMLERLASLRFDVAAMLNLSPDHLDRHRDMAGYVAAKRAVFARQTAEDLAIVGVDDAPSVLTAAWLRTRDARVLAVSGATRLPMEAPALPGAHNAQNAAAATAMATELGATQTDIARGIAGFPGLPHRQRVVGRVEGIAFIDDSKATNADAAARALGCYERIVWIAGGQAKANGIAPLAPYFGRVVRALLIGRDASVLAATLDAHGVAHDIVGTLEAAVTPALAVARASDAVVLLSPACASFDQFSGFEARGLRFAALVDGLAREKAA